MKWNEMKWFEWNIGSRERSSAAAVAAAAATAAKSGRRMSSNVNNNSSNNNNERNERIARYKEERRKQLHARVAAALPNTSSASSTEDLLEDQSYAKYKSVSFSVSIQWHLALSHVTKVVRTVSKASGVCRLMDGCLAPQVLSDFIMFNTVL